MVIRFYSKIIFFFIFDIFERKDKIFLIYLREKDKLFLIYLRKKDKLFLIYLRESYFFLFFYDF